MGHGRVLPTGYVQVPAQAPTGRGSIVYSPFIQEQPLHHAGLFQARSVTQEYTSPYLPTSYNTEIDQGFCEQQQADAPYEAHLSHEMDWTAVQGSVDENATVAMPQVSEQNERSIYQDDGQGQLERLYLEQSGSASLGPQPSYTTAFDHGFSQTNRFHQSLPGSHSCSSIDLQPSSDIDLSLIGYAVSDAAAGFLLDHRADPWSIVNQRTVEPQFVASEANPTQAINQLDVRSLPSTTLKSEAIESSVPQDDPATSETTFNSEIDELTNSWSTVRKVDDADRYLQQSSNAGTYSPIRGPYNAVPFQCRLDRGETPLQIPGDNPGIQVVRSIQ
jgi:hypothetical protein